MRTNPIALNPFSLMMEPELVLRAMEQSTALRALRRRRLHPLDRPLIPYVHENDQGSLSLCPNGKSRPCH